MDYKIIHDTCTSEQGDTYYSNDTYDSEAEGRYITAQVLPSWMAPDVTSLTFTQTTLYDNVDAECTAKREGNSMMPEKKNLSWTMEIKNYSHTWKSTSGEDCIILKEDKLDRMLKRSEGMPCYLVGIVEGKAYLFKADNNIKEYEWKMLKQKVTQKDPNSRWCRKKTYYIPLKDAIRESDITKYKEEWDAHQGKGGLF